MENSFADPAVQPLHLVHDELAATLNDARVALEQHAEAEAGNSALERCANLLHTARGVLQLTETWGASLMAEEMEQTCRHLLRLRRDAQPDDALEALMRAIVQLPAYVERLRNGGRDVPLVLLPLLNDLRAARGKPLLSESTLLLLNLAPGGARRGQAPQREPSGEDIVDLARELRPRFQLALLGWIRDQGASENLPRLTAIAGRLEAAATHEVVHQLWWVVAGVLEALADGGIEPSVAVKRLIGQSDREMKRLQSLGEQKYATQPPVDLVNNLLYYVARAGSSGPRVVAIREAFSLSGLVPGDEQVELARRSLAAPSVRLMQTVASAIREDLARVKDVLDIYVRTGMERIEELVPQVELLKKIGDTLGVLGLGEARGEVESRRLELAQLVSGERQPDEATLVQMATALLSVEDQLEPRLLRLLSPDMASDAAGTPADDDAGDDRVEIVGAVMRECLANLARVKEAITLVTERDTDASALDAVPSLLRGITAALLILEKDRAAATAEGIAAAASRVVNAGSGRTDRHRLERLADAIVSLEYYMETIQAGRRDPDWMLDNAARCLEALQQAVERPERTAAVGPAPFAEAGAGEPTLVIDSAPPPPAPEPQRERPSADRPVVAAGADGIDPDILELFIEEAREALEGVQARLPEWIRDEGSRDALLSVRRAYHTLKGSGRMVGAQLIGEFSWSVESLLNRVIDGTVARSRPLLEFLERAHGAAAELLEQLEVGSEPSADIPRLMAEAETLLHPGTQAVEEVAAEETGPAPEVVGPDTLHPEVIHLTPASVAEEEPAEDEAPGPEAGISPVWLPDADAGQPIPAEFAEASVIDPGIEPGPDAGTDPGIDPVLLDILSREVAGHLAVLNTFLDRAAAGARAIPEELFRAGHTLHGNLTMAGVAPAVAIAGPLNDLVGTLYEGRLVVESEEIGALRRAGSRIAAIVEDLGSTAPRHLDTGDLEAELAALTAAAGERATAGAEDADSGTMSMETLAADEDAEAAPAGPGRPDTRHADTFTGGLTYYDVEVAEIFADEAAELLEAGEHALARLCRSARDEAAMAELQRSLHTLKGGARMAGLPTMGDLSHELEALLLRTTEGGVPATADTWSLVQAALDELHRLREQIPNGNVGAAAPALLARLAAAQAGRPEAGEPASAVGPDDAEPEYTAPTPAIDSSLAMPAEAVQAGSPLPEADTDPVPAATQVEPEAGDESIDAATDATTEPAPDEGRVAEVEAAFGGPGLATESAAAAEESATAEGPEIVDEPAAAEAIDSAEKELDDATEGPDPAAYVIAPVPPVPPPALERLGVLARELEAPPVPAPPGAPPLPGVRPPARGRPPEPREFARVEPGLLEQLLNGAGEISIANARLNQQLSSIQFNLDELNQTVIRLRDQLRKLEIETEAQILYRHQGESERHADFDPLELDQYSSIQQLSRALAETASDVSSLKDLLSNLSADTEALLVQQARTTNELQDGLMRTRMVPFDQHASRLARLVRQTARETGKQAELVIEGSGELDRQVLEKMLPPFEHMLRNAVVHGIETPAMREAAGKDAGGTIRIAIRREGTEVVIRISDDGRGLDVASIRRKAVERGFVSPEMPLTDEEAMQFILKPGFSTADRLTQAAGRGVGMDVVANQVTKLGGTLAIASRAGQGTTFTLRLPFTLAVTQALIVRAGTELYALPLPTVEGIIRISRREFEERMSATTPSIEYGGQKYQFRHLGQFLGLGPTRLPDELDRVSIILVRAAENSTALVADEMLESREIVVKSVGAQLATIRGIAGATILGDGRIVIILDAGALVRLSRPMAETAPPAETESGLPLALVVDDSITMRRVTQRLLERNGFRVVTAKDGIEAVAVLQEHRPDIILLDVEMPRMDGYEFARHVRNNADTAGLPIIMVTSRVSEKHRARAIELGVNDYLGKPYQERELLDAVGHQLGRA